MEEIEVQTFKWVERVQRGSASPRIRSDASKRELQEAGQLLGKFPVASPGTQFHLVRCSFQSERPHRPLNRSISAHLSTPLAQVDRFVPVVCQSAKVQSATEQLAATGAVNVIFFFNRNLHM
jgi:hypothetical protein